MHKCLVCGNRSNNTRVSRPGVIYHGIPKDAYIRRKWLKVFGIDRCYDWQRVCSDHFLEENYKPGAKRFLFSNTIPQPYDRNGFPSNGKKIENAVVNNFKSSRWPTKCLTRNNEDMSNENMPLTPEPHSNVCERLSSVIKDRTLKLGIRCSIKNCLNRLSKDLSLFGYPKDLTLRKKWMEKCGLKKDPDKIVISGTRVCSAHFELDCFVNTKIKNRLKPGAVPSLFLDNALPVSINDVPVLSTCEDQFISPIENEAAEQSLSEKNNFKALPMSINEVPVLSTCEDQFISPIENKAAEKSLSDKNNLKDNTDNTSMIIDLTIDDSSNSPLSITLEPIEKRKNCNAEDFSRDEDGIIFKLSKEVLLPSLYWKSEHLNSQNATLFYEQDANDVTVKKVYFDNNLVPSIEIYGKKYEYTTPITTMKELGNLLEKIYGIEKCYGRGGFVFEQCLGYFENSLVQMCSGCQGLLKDRDFQRMKAKIEAQNKIFESFKNQIAEKREVVLQLRREIADIQRIRELNVTLKQSGISKLSHK